MARCWRRARSLVLRLQKGPVSRVDVAGCQSAARHFLAKVRKYVASALICPGVSFVRNAGMRTFPFLSFVPLRMVSRISLSLVSSDHFLLVKSGTSSLCPFSVSPRPSSPRSEEHTSELQSQFHLVCRLLLE